MDREEIIFSEYKLYSEQKENFINRNFATNRFYMVSLFVVLIAMIYTGNVVFLNRISATLVFALAGTFVCALWWMNVDSYNTLIKVKYADVLEKIEEKFPVKPYTDEYKGIENFRKNKVFMFADIQKIVAVIFALFFFAVFMNEFTPICMAVFNKIANFAATSI